MAWKSHWHHPSPKGDWAEDIRNDLRARFPTDDIKLESLDKMKRGDLMELAYCIQRLSRPRINANLIERLRAYITSTEDAVAPINYRADRELIEEAIREISPPPTNEQRG